MPILKYFILSSLVTQRFGIFPVYCREPLAQVGPMVPKGLLDFRVCLGREDLLAFLDPRVTE